MAVAIGIHCHPLPQRQIEADLRLPEGATGLVMFAHGSGSSRFSRRNRAVADFLEAERLRDAAARSAHARGRTDRRAHGEYRFDIDAAGRARRARDRLGQRPHGSCEPARRLFRREHRRGGRAHRRGRAPDDGARGRVARRAAGPGRRLRCRACWRRRCSSSAADDEPVIGDEPRRDAADGALPSSSQIVPGATHLFEEPGTLEQVMQLAAAWFGRYLHDLENR